MELITFFLLVCIINDDYLTRTKRLMSTLIPNYTSKSETYLRLTLALAVVWAAWTRRCYSNGQKIETKKI